MRDIEMDAMAVMEQIHMQESRHMQMSALVDYQLQYPDLTIRDFFAMASQELEDQDEDFDPDVDYGEMQEDSND